MNTSSTAACLHIPEKQHYKSGFVEVTEEIHLIVVCSCSRACARVRYANTRASPRGTCVYPACMRVCVCVCVSERARERERERERERLSRRFRLSNSQTNSALLQTQRCRAAAAAGRMTTGTKTYLTPKSKNREEKFS